MTTWTKPAHPVAGNETRLMSPEEPDMAAMMLPSTPETVTAHRCKKCGVWREPFCVPSVPDRHYTDRGNGPRCDGEWEPVVYRLVEETKP